MLCGGRAGGAEEEMGWSSRVLLRPFGGVVLITRGGVCVLFSTGERKE